MSTGSWDAGGFTPFSTLTGPGMAWMVQAAGLALLVGQNAAVAAQFFNKASSYAVGGSEPPAGWATTPVRSFTSLTNTNGAAAVWAATTPAPGSWVMYDNEEYSGLNPAANTAVVEQNNPGPYMAEFNALAHAYGLHVINVPGRDLTDITPTYASYPVDAPVMTGPAVCYKGSGGLVGETEDAAFLRCGIPGFAASADVYSCQSQADQATSAAQSRHSWRARRDSCRTRPCGAA